MENLYPFEIITWISLIYTGGGSLRVNKLVIHGSRRRGCSIRHTTNLGHPDMCFMLSPADIV